MNCRVCGHDLETILDLGEQCLGGQFPKIGEPDPPRFPLVLARCTQCKLIQLRDTVDPKLMFTKYGYRSGVTQTMRDHLGHLAKEAVALLGKRPQYVMDIGGNDGTLLNSVGAAEKWLIDPSNVNIELSWSYPLHLIKGFYPHPALVGQKFDLIFSIACFYDVNDPVTFARAVRDNLAPGGLWCVEVADVNAVLAGAWDSICHEHLLYFSCATFSNVIKEAGLFMTGYHLNNCNGGSIRFYLSDHGVYQTLRDHSSFDYNFEWRIQEKRRKLVLYLKDSKLLHKRVHLLGASTKANTVLQYCGITPDLIQYASDRDPRKVGCCTPGTRIPIISEADSRAMKPDVYVCLIHGFKQEVIAREQAFLKAGGSILFPLPVWDEVTIR